MTDSVVIIPTYNELGNIENTLGKVESLKIKFDIIIVDDNSPDGTGILVEEIIQKKKFNLNIHLINRKIKVVWDLPTLKALKRQLN